MLSVFNLPLFSSWPWVYMKYYLTVSYEAKHNIVKCSYFIVLDLEQFYDLKNLSMQKRLVLTVLVAAPVVNQIVVVGCEELWWPKPKRSASPKGHVPSFIKFGLRARGGPPELSPFGADKTTHRKSWWPQSLLRSPHTIINFTQLQMSLSGNSDFCDSCKRNTKIDLNNDMKPVSLKKSKTDLCVETNRRISKPCSSTLMFFNWCSLNL